MEINTLETYLMGKVAITKENPFGPGVDVYKVHGKMFALVSFGNGNEKDTDGKMKGFYCVNLKCDPDEALLLRDIFDAVIPGYHMNKVNWNTVILNGSIPQGEIERMIDNSYLLVVKTMTKKVQKQLGF